MRKPARRTSSGALLIALGYAVVLWALSVLRYHLWLAHGDDLGFFAQGLWLLGHGHWLAPSSYTGRPVLADAAAWVLVPLAGVYRLGGIWALLAVQALALAAGYPLIWALGTALGLAPERTRPVALAYLVYPTVVAVALYDFHPDAFAVPIGLGLALACVRRRWVAFGLWGLAALAVKDTAGVMLVGVALAAAAQRRWLVAFLTACAGLAGLWLDAGVFIPRLGQAVIAQWPAVYGYLGPTPGAGVVHLLGHPLLFLAPLAHARAWEYLVWMVGPLVALMAPGWRRILTPWWLPAVVVLEMNLLGRVPSLTSPFDEFAAWAVPFLFAACLDMRRAAPRAAIHPRPSQRWAAALALVFFVVFAAQQVHSFWLGGPTNRAALRAAVRVVPVGAAVAAQDFVLPHVADRRDAWHLAALPAGTTFPSGTYVILDPADDDPLDAAALPVVARRVAAPGAATRIFAASGVTVYRLRRPLGPGN